MRDLGGLGGRRRSAASNSRPAWRRAPSSRARHDCRAGTWVPEVPAAEVPDSGADTAKAPRTRVPRGLAGPGAPAARERHPPVRTEVRTSREPRGRVRAGLVTFHPSRPGWPDRSYRSLAHIDFRDLWISRISWAVRQIHRRPGLPVCRDSVAGVETLAMEPISVNSMTYVYPGSHCRFKGFRGRIFTVRSRTVSSTGPRAVMPLTHMPVDKNCGCRARSVDAAITRWPPTSGTPPDHDLRRRRPPWPLRRPTR